MNKYKKSISVILFIGVISISAFLIINTYNKSNNDLSDQSQTILAAKDFSTADNLEDMISNSELVVVGNYKSLNKTWNMADNSENEDEYVEGRLYNFSISEVLKGDDIKNIKINHRYSENIPVDITSGDEEISPEGILIKEPTSSETVVIENKDPLFIEPDFDKKYIAFLKKGDTGNYYPAIEPYLIEFDKNNTASLKSNLIDLDKSELSTVTEIKGREIVVQNEMDENISDNITGKTYDNIKKDIIKLIEHQN